MIKIEPKWNQNVIKNWVCFCITFWTTLGGIPVPKMEFFGSFLGPKSDFQKVPTLSKHCACHVDLRFGPLQNEQNRAQNRVFWRCGARSCSGAYFYRFWSSFWEPFGTKMTQKADPKNDRRFLGRIKKRSWGFLGSARRNNGVPGEDLGGV